MLAGSGDNGGDALYAGARLARRGAQVEALLLSPDKVHAGGLAALRAAGGREVAAIRTPPTWCLDGIVGIGGSAGLRPEAADVWDRRAQRLDATVVWRSTCPAGWVSTTARSTASASTPT